MAEYDLMTGGVYYKGNVSSIYQQYSPLSTQKLGNATNLVTRWGLALWRISQAYPDQDIYLRDATTLWNIAFQFFVGDTTAQSGRLPSSNVTFHATCNNLPVAGGIFSHFANITAINGQTIGPFISLSSLLYRSNPTNTTYAFAANQSIQFVQRFLTSSNLGSNGPIIYDTYDIGYCALNVQEFTYNSAYVIEGISNYINITGDQTYVSYLNSLAQGVVLFPGWTNSGGLNIEASPDAVIETPSGVASDGKALLIHGLYVFLETGGLNSTLSLLVRDYIAIQFNAIRTSANSTINGQQFYSSSWIGQRPDGFDAVGQLSAAEVFNAVLGLSNDGLDMTPTSLPPISATTLPPRVGAHSSHTDAIVGGTVGGSVATLCAAGLVIFIRRRRRASEEADALSHIRPDMAIVDPFPHDAQHPSEPSSATTLYYDQDSLKIERERRRNITLSSDRDGGTAFSRGPRASFPSNSTDSNERRELPESQIPPVDPDVLRQFFNRFVSAHSNDRREDDAESTNPPRYDAVPRRES